MSERASWKGADLEVETEFGRGGKWTETYSMSTDGQVLSVTAKMEPPRGDAFEVKSVYEKER